MAGAIAKAEARAERWRLPAAPAAAASAAHSAVNAPHSDAAARPGLGNQPGGHQKEHIAAAVMTEPGANRSEEVASFASADDRFEVEAALSTTIGPLAARPSSSTSPQAIGPLWAARPQTPLLETAMKNELTPLEPPSGAGSRPETQQSGQQQQSEQQPQSAQQSQSAPQQHSALHLQPGHLPYVGADFLHELYLRLDRIETAVTRLDDKMTTLIDDVSAISNRVDVLEVTMNSWEDFTPDCTGAQHYQLASGATTPRNEECDLQRAWLHDQSADLVAEAAAARTPYPLGPQGPSAYAAPQAQMMAAPGAGQASSTGADAWAMMRGSSSAPWPPSWTSTLLPPRGPEQGGQILPPRSDQPAAARAATAVTTAVAGQLN